jgi:hypothetical protein
VPTAIDIVIIAFVLLLGGSAGSTLAILLDGAGGSTWSFVAGPPSPCSSAKVRAVRSSTLTRDITARAVTHDGTHILRSCQREATPGRGDHV